jgi:hypothetical protein
MPEFSEILMELRAGLDDPEQLHERLRDVLDPDLLDRASAFSTARGLTFAQTMFQAAELFMLFAAEDSWLQFSREEHEEAAFGRAALNVILERYLSMRLGAPPQELIEGPSPRSPSRQFRRMP